MAMGDDEWRRWAAAQEAKNVRDAARASQERNAKMREFRRKQAQKAQAEAKKKAQAEAKKKEESGGASREAPGCTQVVGVIFVLGFMFAVCSGAGS